MMTRLSSSQRISVKSANDQLRGCLFYVGRGLMWFVIGLAALGLLSVVYQTVAPRLDSAPTGRAVNSTS